MTMPPSGVTGIMDEEALIEAEIRFELDNINLDAGDDALEPVELEQLDENPDNAGPLDTEDVSEEFDAYLKRIQEQTSRFEQELEECDDVLNHSTSVNTAPPSSGALVLYDDHQLLVELAQDSGCDVEAYRQKILAEIENDDDIIVDELTDLMVPESDQLSLVGADQNLAVEGSETPLQITEAGERDKGLQHGPGGEPGHVIDHHRDKIATNIQRAVEEGMDPEDTPVCQAVVSLDGPSQEQTSSHIDIQKVLREQLDRLEQKYDERIDKVKKDQAFRRDEEELRERRLEEERQWKKQEYEREEQRLTLERELAERRMEKDREEAERQMQTELRQFETEMRVLQEDMQRQQRDHQMAVKQEEDRQAHIQQQAATRMQKMYRGYRVRKQYGPELDEKRKARRQEKEEERIKELEIVIERRNEEKKENEEKEKQRKEEETRKHEELKALKEEEKRQKELEKKQKEEEKRRQKEEEERKKQEEKKRKEEEKKRKKEEEKQKKEEEKKRKEEEKKRKLEEEQRKKEEKKLKEEEEKRKKEEEKQRIIEEEKKKKEQEEENIKMVEVGKTKESELKNEVKVENKEQENQTKTEDKKIEEKMTISDEKHSILTENKSEPLKETTESITAIDTNKVPHTVTSDTAMLAGVTAKTTNSINTSKANDSNLSHTVTTVNNSQSLSKPLTPDGKGTAAVGEVKVGPKSSVEAGRMKTPRSARTPRPPTPRKAKDAEAKDKKTGNITHRTENSPEKPALEKVDCLPEHLETLRIGFIKDCLPWSKVSNEPWKLKSGSTRKPLRRPSSAKKLPLLTDGIILQAGRVASLKQVTTVELTDLPGNNMSSLGQCTGLKYLVMTRCNLVALDGLNQCLQLQYLDVHDNKLEFMDVKDHGQLQYVNASQNRLSSVHGLDNCTNLRWLDLSHNNITRIGGLETLRRLHTLKLSHNQLISTHGLGDTPTLQMIDISHNHLQAVEDLHKLCLLVTLDLSANTLLKVPDLQNQVLLLELLVNDNSISSVEELSKPWLPLLHTIHLGQNSIDDLPSLGNCLLLRHLDVSNNQLLDTEIINRCVSGCFYLEQLCVEENPVEQDINESFYTKLKQTSCPRLLSQSGSLSNVPPLKPRTSFETMCLTQDHTLKDVFTQFDANIRSVQTVKSAGDPAKLCDMYLRHCEKTFNLAVEYRYAHEYGEVSVTMPTAPTMPKSGRPLSARQKDKFINPKDLFENALKSSNTNTSPQHNVDTASNPKDLFENALRSSNSKMTPQTMAETASNPKDLFENALRSSNSKMTPQTMADTASNPKDLFENALKSSSVNSTNPKDLFEAALHPSNKISSSGRSDVSTNDAEFSGISTTTTADVKSAKDLFSAALRDTEQNGANGHIHGSKQAFSNGLDETAVTGKQASDIVPSGTARKEILSEQSAPMAVQAGWQGNSTRKTQNGELDQSQGYQVQGSEGLEHLHESAVKIQAIWRGYILRKKLMAALEYAQCDFDDEEDEDAMDFGDEFDLDKFVDIDQDLIDTDWRPPTTPDIPKHHPVLGKPPTGHPPVVPPINTGDLRPPSNPRRAWKNFESPLSDIGKIPRPPSSVASTNLTARSKKEEKLSEEWGFRDTNTAHLMMQRAKKMKYNAERRKKISKLDPKQRLALFRRLEEVIPPETQYVPQRKVLPRKEYFQARQEEIYREEQEKKEVFHTRASRTFEWLHTQVGDHTTTDSIINQGLTTGPKYVPEGGNLPELQGGRRVQLVSSPGSLELQSVESVSSAGHKSRRFSAGSGHSIGKLPPIQTTSAPTDHVKERMSFRNPKANQSVGWGGGKKRGNSGT